MGRRGHRRVVEGLAIGAAVAAVLLLIAWRRESARAATLERLERGAAPLPAGMKTAAAGPDNRPRTLALFTGLVVGLVCALAGANAAISLASGVVTFVGVSMIVGTLMERRQQKMERQLAEAIDIAVSSLRAGAGISDALADAAEIAQPPLRGQLENFLGRIRLGEDPVAVCKDMAGRVRLEAVRLFYFALAVHWEGGGSLAHTLATTGRFIRDRTEVGRRIRAQSAQARYSVLGILCLTYVLAALMWRADPPRMEGFLGTTIGQSLVAIAAMLQAVGAGWISRMSRIRF